MKVLSLFNGISCGRVALDRANIEVERYVSYEIEKHANAISQYNYPNDEYFGDVTTADFTQYKGFDLVIGGSPCTYWSIAKKDREITSEGVGFELFSHFARAVKETECKYFLYENNDSIHKDIKVEISKYLGVEPIMINSALLSAQNRKRCYWVGVRQDNGTYKPASISHAKNLEILLKDILISGLPVCDNNNKSQTIKYQYGKNGIANTQRQGTQAATMVAEPLKVGVLPTKTGTLLSGRGMRVNSADGKGVTLVGNGGGMDALTGLYTVPIKFENNVPLKAISLVNNKEYKVYEVKDKFINYNGRQCKLNLENGFYIIRKLTPVETERLQTLPDNYTLFGIYEDVKKIVADTNRYKGVGNGWTVDVIAHIFKNLGENK